MTIAELVPKHLDLLGICIWTITPMTHLRFHLCFSQIRKLLRVALVHNSRSRSIIALHPEIRGPA